MPDESPAKAGPQSRRKLPLAAIIAVAAVVLLGGGIGAYFAFRSTADPAAAGSGSADASQETIDVAIAGALPKDVTVYIELPHLRKSLESMGKMGIFDASKADSSQLVEQVLGGVSDSFGMSKLGAASLLAGLESMGIGVRKLAPKQQPEVAVLIQFRSAGPVGRLLGGERFTAKGGVGKAAKRYQLAAQKGGTAPAGLDPKAILDSLSTPSSGSLDIYWFAGARLLMVGSEPMAKAIDEVLAGGEAFATNTTYQQTKAKLPADAVMTAYVDPALFQGWGAADPEARKVVDGIFAKPVPITASFRLSEAGTRFTATAGLAGELMPEERWAAAPAALDLPNKLPAETLGYLAYSSKLPAGMTGKQLADALLAELARLCPDAVKAAEEQLTAVEEKTGLELATFLDAVGDQGLIAFVPPKELQLDLLDGPDPTKHFTALWVQHLRSEAAAKEVVGKLRTKVLAPLLADAYRLVPQGAGFRAEPKTALGAPPIRLQFHSPYLVVGVGQQALVDRSIESLTTGKNTLGDEPAHRRAHGQLGESPHAVAWMDTGRLLEVSGLAAGPLAGLRNTGPNRLTSGFAVGWSVTDGLWTFRTDWLNGAGVFAGLGVYGLRRYIGSSKTAEAKNTIGAITRGTMAAFERESASGGAGQLCKSAQPVPAQVPRGRKYQPNTGAGQDYETGDEHSGWKCLKFSISQPHYYQYFYTQGGPYKGPALGGPDPGPQGFEAAAVGDLDGDGKTSLFTSTGTIDPETGRLRLSTQIFIHDEFE